MLRIDLNSRKTRKMILLETSFLKDYSDYIVLIPSVILGGIVAYWIYLKQRTTKEIGIERISLNNIIEIDSKYKNSIEVKFQDKNVDKLWLLILKFSNKGNTPIEKKDFESPILISFDSKNEILNNEAISSNPKDLNVKITKTNNIIELAPLLLNPNDSFALRFMISGGSPEYKVTSRISGIKEISHKKSEPNKSFSKGHLISILVGMVFTYIIATFVGSATYSILVPPKVDIFNPNISKSKDGSLGNITLVATSGTALEKNLIYYKVNTSPFIERAVFQDNSWEIDLNKSKRYVVETGRNKLCYSFDEKDDIFECLDFIIIKE